MGLPIKKLRAANEINYAKLVRAAQKGDRSAFAALIEAMQTRLFRFALTLVGEKSAAEDLCQEAFLKVFDKLSSLEQPSSFPDWLFRVTKNLFLDQVRSSAHKFTDSSDPETFDAIEIRADSPDLTTILAVHRVLSQFEPEERYLLLLIDLEERSYKEASEIMGTSEDAVRSRIFRLRKSFLEIWKKSETKSS